MQIGFAVEFDEGFSGDENLVIDRRAISLVQAVTRPPKGAAVVLLGVGDVGGHDARDYLHEMRAPSIHLTSPMVRVVHSVGQGLRQETEFWATLSQD